ncbi:MAG: hypothetical protein COZ12_07005, partial [Deltaproteobacteria bacterium CG_4_10_14_3_um_filter_60_8]
MRCTLLALNARFTHSCLALFAVRNALEQHLPDCEIKLLAGTINDPYLETLLSLADLEADALFF